MNRRVQPRYLVLLAVTFSVLVAAVVFGASTRGGNPPATRTGRQSSTPATAAVPRTLPEGFDSSDEATKPAPSRKLTVDPSARETRTAPARTVAVVFARDLSAAELRRAETKYGFRVVERIPNIGWTIVEPTTASTSVEELADTLAEAGLAKTAEPSSRVHRASTPSDPRYGEQWGFANTGQSGGIPGADMKAEAAWDWSRGDSVVVAVVDEGVEIDHADLSGQVWVNSDEIAGNGIDDDSNGKVDDVNGWDFLNSDATVYDAVDGDMHGTHVAGTVAAGSNNATGGAGTAPGARIMPLKFLGRDGGDTAAGAAAIVYAVDNGARVVNCSWGGTIASSVLNDAIAYAASKGVLVVAAAGNSSANADVAPLYPAASNATNVVSVAALNRVDELASFSNYGASTVDLGAPGEQILSTKPVHQAAVMVDAGAYRVAYLAYPFDKISDAGTRDAVMDRAIGQLATSTANPILVVDDSFPGWTGENSLAVYTQALTSAGYSDVTTWVTETSGTPTAAAMSGKTVVWYTGKAGFEYYFAYYDAGYSPPTAMVTLATAERAEVQTFLESGGRMLISSGELGYDMNSFMPAWGSWYRGYFHTECASYSAWNTVAIGRPGSLLDGLTATLIGNPFWTDEIVPLDSNATPLADWGTDYFAISGTSMAAPHVSGALALAFSRTPTASAADIRGRLLSTAVPIDALAGKCVTGGRLDAAALVGSLQKPSFGAIGASGADTAKVTWANHPDAYYESTKVLYRQGAAVTGPNDPAATVLYQGTSTDATATGLTAGSTLNFSAYSRNTLGSWTEAATSTLTFEPLDAPVATVPVGNSPAVVGVDPLSHNVYVGNYYGDSVTVIDGVARSAVATIPMPTAGSIAVPITAAVDVLSGKAYIGNFWSNYVSVIDGSTLGIVATISPPASHASGVRAVAVDPSGATTKVYAAIFGKNIVSVIDGSTDTIAKNIPVGTSPRAIAVFASGSRRRVYVANRYSNNVSIIDANTDSVVATAQTGAEPKVIAVDPNRGFAYVTSPASDTVTVIDDSDQVTATISVGDNPTGVAVDPAGRRVFVANYASNSVSVIDADTLSVVATVATGVQPISLAVDRSSRKVYVSCYGSSSVTVIDSSLFAASIPTGYRPYALGVDEGLAAHQVYSANWGANSVTIIDPPGSDAGPVSVTITPMSGDATASSSPTFSGTASSARSPLSSNIVAVFYRIDADQTWHRAQIVSGAGSPAVTWRAAPSGSLSEATHTIEVAAIDQALAVTSSSDQGAGGDSAALGGGTAYEFAVEAGTAGPTLVDAGFESRSDGTSLDPGVWTLFGAPARAEYDTLRAKNGSLSAWIQGSASTAYTGVLESETGAMSSDGAEIRFWTYFDTTSNQRIVDDVDPSINNAARAFLVNFQNNGALSVYTSKAGNPGGYTTNAYTPVGTYTTGWTQYRLVMDFTNQTYTLSSRANAADAWTQIKAPGATGYGIPMLSASTVTATHGTRWRSYYAAQWWVDDIAYSPTGISDGGTGPDTTAPTAPAALSATDHPADSGGSIDLSWLAASDNVAVTGYRLYRGTAPGVYGAPTALGNVTSFTDATAVTGTRYYYAVSALDAAGNEGATSPEASAVSADDLAPAVPTGLSATPGTAQVALSWNANTESDLAGYNVYRGGVKLTAVPVPAATYTDTGLADGTYAYTVSAVDATGNESARCPAVPATVGTVTPPTGPALVDAGFESRTDATALDPGIWTLFGAPAKAEYDTLRAKNGSLSAWIQGSASTAYTGVIESETGAMSSDGAEIRFWTYFDNTTTGRLVDDIDPSINNAARAFLVNFQNNGALSVYTSKAGNPGGYTTNAYTPVGTYATGWTQYRLVMDFTDQTYTLSSRLGATDAWTPIKAPGATGYAIPMLSASPVTATHGTRWRSYYAAQWWVDDIAYSPTGISDPDTTAPAVPTGLVATPGTAQVALSWNANTEPDLSGYKVYRDGVLLTPVPIPAAAYTDALLIDGTYSYTVSAVDNTGNESARSGVVVATVGTVTPPDSGTLVDAGFENGVDGTALDSGTWTLFGAPAKAEYDNARAKNGTQSAWIQGTAAAAYTGVIESETGAMSSDGAEIRFWTYFDTTTTGRLVDDIDPSINNAARAFLVNFQNNGALSVYTSKAGNPNGYTTNAYTPVGTYTTGWTQYRLVMDFTNQTYTLSSRANAADAWTPIKAPGATGYAIPMLSASTVTATHGTRWRSYYAAQWWVDDIAYSPTGIVDGGTGPDTTAPSVPTSVGVRSSYWEGHMVVQWAAATDNVGVAGYRVYRGAESGDYDTSWEVAADRLVLVDTDKALVTGQRYYYVVSAFDAMGNESGRSLEASGIVLNTRPPNPPTGCSVEWNSIDPGCNVDWNANTDGDLAGYNLYRDGVKVNDSLIVTTEFTDTAANYASSRTYWATAVDVAGNESEPGHSITVYGFDTVAPSVPEQFSAVDTPDDTGGSVSLTWLASTDNGDQLRLYRVYRGTAPGVYDTVWSLSDGWSPPTSFTDTSCVTGTSYYYAVTALDRDCNESTRSVEVSAVPQDNQPDTLAPAIPAGLTATSGYGQIELSWNANTEPDLAGYYLFRDNLRVTTHPITDTSYTDTALAEGAQHSYDLVAVDERGNSSAKCVAVNARTLVRTGTLVDAGFESRSDATALDPGIWTLFGAPARAEYDTLRSRNGSLSAWIQGSTSTAYTGVIETKTGAMSSDGAEIRFWTYFDTTSTGRLVDDIDPSINNAARAFLVNFQNNGALSVYTSKAGNPGGYTTNAYTPVGTYTTGWTQYRLVMDFTNQTYTLSSRLGATDAWTQIKAPGATGYAIPMLSASVVTATHGTRWRSYYAASMWVDDLTYSASGFFEGDTTPPTAPSTATAVDWPDDQGGSIKLSWSASTDDVGVTGYRVYYGESPGVYTATLPLLPAEARIAKLSFATGARRYFAVSAVDAAGNEGPKSPEASATALDNLPPAVPNGLAVVGGAGQAALSWTANTDADLMGYLVYRDGYRLFMLPLADASYVDTLLAAGTYSYQVCAVDMHGNSSALSPAVLAAVD